MSFSGITHTVTLWYGEGVKKPKSYGDLAIESIHRSEASAEFEVAAAKTRKDIGTIRFNDLNNPEKSYTLKRNDDPWVKVGED